MKPVILERKTKETQISLQLNINGTGQAQIQSGVGFFDHLLSLLSFHAHFDLNLKCQGDLEVDEHHSIEDIGITLGQAFREALAEKMNYHRYGSCWLPMDEILAHACVDISGRPFFVLQAEFKREKVGEFPTEMVSEFFRAFATNARLTLHLRIEYGENEHHKIEALFKATAYALREALEIVPGRDAPSSTKGIL
jgi:imidazoleglycerol-phosphate dehydratase